MVLQNVQKSPRPPRKHNGNLGPPLDSTISTTNQAQVTAGKPIIPTGELTSDLQTHARIIIPEVKTKDST